MDIDSSNNEAQTNNKVEEKGSVSRLEFKHIFVKAGNVQILNDINGQVTSCEVLALMGPSGSGKTTLLNSLSYRHELLGVSKKNISGEITLNGKALTKKDKNIIGYVMQDDIFFENLTLKETLQFYSNVRLPKTLTEDEKNKIVMDLVSFFNLTKCMNTLIGGNFTHGLSGGEKKRVNVVIEMMTDPKLLFLDEPTSGLDSNMAYSLVNNLKELSQQKQKIIITSIHQPNSQIFFSFTNLLLLSQGTVVYNGSVNKVADFFAVHMYPCIKGWNIADHMIEMVQTNSDFSKNVIQKNILKQETKLNENMDEDSLEFEELDKANKSSIYLQLSSLCSRSFNNARSQTFNMLQMSRIIIISILIGMLFYQIAFDEANFQAYLGLYFLLPTLCFSEPMFSNLIKFLPETMIIRRERMSGMYNLYLYYIGKILGDFPIILVRATLLYTIIYFMSNTYYSPWFLLGLLHIYLVSLMGQSIGLFVGAIGLPFTEAIAFIVIYFTFILLTGGFFNSNLPYYIRWAKYLSPLHYSFILQLQIRSESTNGIDCILNNSTSVSNKTVSLFKSCEMNLSKATTEEILQIVKADLPIYAYVLLTIGMIAVLHVLGYLSLKKTFSRPLNAVSIEMKLVNLFRGLKKKSH